jgi:tetratricopeptide (TPR) repeat protein
MTMITSRLSILSLALLLAACGAISVRNEPTLSNRAITAASTSATLPAAPAAGAAGQNDGAKVASEREARRKDGLRLARLLRDQGRLQAATGVYAQLNDKGLLAPLEMLEYASVAATGQSAQESLALFVRSRRELQRTGEKLLPAAQITLCGGMGRSRLSLGQIEEALADFNCVLALDADNLSALNGRGVALDALGRHEDARVALAHAMEVDPADFRVSSNLAMSYLASGQHEEAIRLLKRAGVTGLPTARLNLSLAYLLDGQDGQAARTLREFMPERLADKTLQALLKHRTRIRDGAEVSAEFLAASNQLLALREEATR